MVLAISKIYIIRFPNLQLEFQNIDCEDKSFVHEIMHWKLQGIKVEQPKRDIHSVDMAFQYSRGSSNLQKVFSSTSNVLYGQVQFQHFILIWLSNLGLKACAYPIMITRIFPLQDIIKKTSPITDQKFHIGANFSSKMTGKAWKIITEDFRVFQILGFDNLRTNTYQFILMFKKKSSDRIMKTHVEL